MMQWERCVGGQCHVSCEVQYVWSLMWSKHEILILLHLNLFRANPCLVIESPSEFCAAFMLKWDVSKGLPLLFGPVVPICLCLSNISLSGGLFPVFHRLSWPLKTNCAWYKAHASPSAQKRLKDIHISHLEIHRSPHSSLVTGAWPCWPN